jgi:acetolactate synthase-1/2/3 large subunit
MPRTRADGAMTDARGANAPIGGELLADTLVAHGVETVFCLAGTAHTFLLRALARRNVAICSTRHEATAVLAADGYARTSGRTGVALIKNDQGLPNALTGICTANAACSPVVVLSSLGPRSGVEAGGDTHAAELDIALPVAKWVRVVPAAERLGEFLGLAMKRARDGRPGVALLGFPQEMLGRPVPETAIRPVHPPAAPPAPDRAAILRVADLLAAAERPIILAGAGAMLSGAGEALAALATRHRVPVFGNSLGRGLVPEDGARGFSWPYAQTAARRADLVIAAGIRFTQRLGYGLPPRFAADARVVQIDILPEEIGRNRPVDIAVQADAAQALAALLAELDARGAEPRPEPAWIAEALAARDARIAEIGHDETGDIHPYRIGRALRDLLPPDAVVVGDGADILNWLHGVYFVQRPRCYMDHYPFGSMGVGTGLALGAAAALRDEARRTGRPARPLVLLTGDGAFGFYCADLHSFAHADLPVLVLIANDGAWGTEHHGQLKAIGESYNTLLGKSDYHRIGEAFGFHARRIEAPAEVKPAIAEALARGGRTLLNILTDTAAGALRKSDPRVQTVAFEDLASSLKTLGTPDVA